MKSFRPVPADKYQVQITDVTLVRDMNQFKGEEEDRLNFEFTILDKNNYDYVDEDNNKVVESTRGRRLWKRISPVLSAGGKNSKASWFYKLLCAVNRKDIPAENLAEISPASLIGQQVIAWVEVAKEYNNILNFSAATEDLEPVPNADERIQEEQEKGSSPEVERVAKAFEEEPLDKKLPNEDKKEDDFIAGLEKDKAKE